MDLSDSGLEFAAVGIPVKTYASLLALTSLCWSQTAASPSPQVATSDTVIKSTTRAVVLDVVVHDRSGQPVRGLTKSDFDLVEDGHSQTVAAFEEANGPIPSPGMDESAQTIILIDDMNSKFEDVAYVRHCVEKLLRRKGGRLDQSTALLALTNDGLIVLHQPARDGNALLAALEAHRTALAWRQLGGIHGEMERIDLSLGAMHEIAIAGIGSRVRRNVIWISPGFPLTSATTYSEGTQAHIFEAIRRLSDELLRARIVVYTIDPRVIPPSITDIDSSESGFGQSFVRLAKTRRLDFQDVALPRFAHETGGRSFWGRNDIDNQVAECAKDGGHYYTLVCYPTNRKFDGNFRNITVRVNRPRVDPRTRAGYFAMPEPTASTKKETNDRLERDLSNPLPFVAVPLKASITPAADNSREFKVQVEIDRHSLKWATDQNGDQRYELVAGTATFLNKAIPADIKAHGFSSVIPAATAAKDPDKPIVLQMTIPLAPKATRLRIVVRDTLSGQTGSTEINLPVDQAGKSLKR